MGASEPPILNGKLALYREAVRMLFHTLGAVGIVAAVAIFFMAGGRVPVLQRHEVKIEDPVIQLDPKVAAELRRYNEQIAAAQVDQARALAALMDRSGNLEDGLRELQRTALRQSIMLENWAQVQSKTDAMLGELLHQAREDRRNDERRP